MSNSLMVRQTCGVHRPLMRAIERVLRKPGMSFGKVMILCGGPDWPTSVLAGILRLSLFQCILGTCPIIVSVITLVLTGSFYLKGAEGEIWMRLGNFMFIATGLLNMLFWAGLAWAIQDEYEKNQQEITAPREEFVELEWADYRAARIAERCAVAWQDVPRLIRAPYVLGAVGLGLVGHLFFVKSKSCFGVFALGDNIDSVQWLGEQGLIRPLGVIGCYAAALSFVLLVPYKAWRTRQGRRLAREVKRELAAEEEEWKAAFLRKARGARCNRVGSIEDLSAVHMQAAGLADGDAAGAADEADVAARSKLGAQLDGSGDAAGEEGQQLPMTLTEKAIIIDI